MHLPEKDFIEIVRLILANASINGFNHYYAMFFPKVLW